MKTFVPPRIYAGPRRRFPWEWFWWGLFLGFLIGAPIGAFLSTFRPLG